MQIEVVDQKKYTYSFEKLEIWQKAIDLSVQIYKTTSTFPSEEKFGLISQIRRSCNSISANIAEGSVRLSAKDRARFIQISFGSTIELLNHLILANKLGFIEEKDLTKYRNYIQELTNKINAFHKSVLNQITK